MTFCPGCVDVQIKMIKWQLPVLLDGQVLIHKKNEKPSVQQEQWKFLSTYFHIL